jgi:hypothetical protein
MSAAEDRRRLLELERELWHRRCRQDFVSFCVEALSAQNLVPATHHRLICARLQAVAEGKIDRLMILAPPGSAKTTYTSRLFPAWFLAFKPGANIIAASHTASLAEENSGQVQRIVRDRSATSATASPTIPRTFGILRLSSVFCGTRGTSGTNGTVHATREKSEYNLG